MENSLNPEKQVPVDYDFGNLAVFDPNGPEDNTEESLKSSARDSVQLMISQILQMPIKSTKEAVYVTLPEPSTHLPREKPIPQAKPPTKWEKFAKAKGITPKRKDGRMVYDEQTQEWVPKWGYKGKNKSEQDQWAVELPDNAETI
ncbi:hypothetical protein CANCADRAFT_32366 [Tortispora caseinolytica NRRL Y-17796]|uniref:Ribosome biogenesis regulatory protein n=1 Tax=Tortispora caseinolytica NRRL Y-17796 TaxID=767744 RepID=A0A1E4TAZ2_9ASCO|nr:hypothetical protein CANCADRAFT_32366 [Tortispora caseinolytica NRRL Y-17796]